MSSSALVELPWGDGEHRFRLAIGQLRELQTKCAAGPLEVLDRLANRRWRIDDIRETIRLGLIGGGGVDPINALALIAVYIDERPIMESIPTAQAVLAAALVGVSDDIVGKEAEGAGTGNSFSRNFMEPEPQSAGQPASSTTSASGSSRRRSTVTTAPKAAKSRRPN